MGELDFINYLALNQMPVSRPVPSQQEKWVEVLPQDDGQAFLALMYEKIPGREMKKEDMSSRLFQELGSLMGNMHWLSQNYTLPDPS